MRSAKCDFLHTMRVLLIYIMLFNPIVSTNNIVENGLLSIIGVITIPLKQKPLDLF
jgi:hypothetical protein